jgi:hypothetical protein
MPVPAAGLQPVHDPRRRAARARLRRDDVDPPSRSGEHCRQPAERARDVSHGARLGEERDTIRTHQSGDDELAANDAVLDRDARCDLRGTTALSSSEQEAHFAGVEGVAVVVAVRDPIDPERSPAANRAGEHRS